MQDYNVRKTLKDFRTIWCMAAFFIMLTLILISIMWRNVLYEDTSIIPFDDNWSFWDGEKVDFENLELEEDVTYIHRVVDGKIINAKTLCFYTKNIFFSVYVDGSKVYDFRPDVPRYMGKAYGIYPHTITMPDVEGEVDIKMIVENAYPGKTGYIHEMHLDKNNHFIINELQESMIEFLIGCIIFIFGFTLSVIGIVGKYFGDNKYEILSFGTFAMASSLWVVSNTPAFAIITCAPTVIHFIGYIAIDLMSYPGVLFAAYITGHKKSRLTVVIAIISAIKIIGSIISTTFGYKDYHQLLWISHLIIILGIILFIFYTVMGLIQKTIRRSFTAITIGVFSVALVMGAVDIGTYMNNPYDFISISRYKIFLYVFTFFCGLYEFYMITEMSKRGKYAEIMEELAYKDGLTGLLNRKAFNLNLKKAEESSSNTTFVMIDMNYLKKVNDEMGHNFGDVYITHLAEYLSKAFDDKELVFRMGGDEFFVMTPYSPDSEHFKESLAHLGDMIKDFNRSNDYEIEMSIAYGCAVYDPSQDKSNEKVKEADERMYNMKVEMKAQRT